MAHNLREDSLERNRTDDLPHPTRPPLNSAPPVEEHMEFGHFTTGRGTVKVFWHFQELPRSEAALKSPWVKAPSGNKWRVLVVPGPLGVFAEAKISSLGVNRAAIIHFEVYVYSTLKGVEKISSKLNQVFSYRKRD